jgi:hypothetical protein
LCVEEDAAHQGGQRIPSTALGSEVPGPGGHGDTTPGEREGRRTLLEPDAYSQLPLQAACRNRAHLDAIDLLLGHNEGKSTVMQGDHKG